MFLLWRVVCLWHGKEIIEDFFEVTKKSIKEEIEDEKVITIFFSGMNCKRGTMKGLLCSFVST